MFSKDTPSKSQSCRSLDPAEAESLLEPFLLGRLDVEREDALVSAMYDNLGLHEQLEECEEALMLRHVRGQLNLGQFPLLASRWSDKNKQAQLSYLRSRDAFSSRSKKDSRKVLRFYLVRAGAVAAMLAVAIALGVFIQFQMHNMAVLQVRMGRMAGRIEELGATNARLEQQIALQAKSTTPITPQSDQSRLQRISPRDAAAGATQGNFLPDYSSYGAGQAIHPQDPLIWLPADLVRFGGRLNPDRFEARLTYSAADAVDAVSPPVSIDRDALTIRLPDQRLPVWLTLRYRSNTTATIILDRLKLVSQSGSDVRH